MKTDNTNLIVGANLRTRRKELHMNIQQLAKKLDMSYQQVNKFERGVDRLSVDRLLCLSKVLGVDITYFFQGCDVSGNDEVSAPFFNKLPKSVEKSIPTEYRHLVNSYAAIKDKKLRSQVLAFIHNLSGV